MTTVLVIGWLATAVGAFLGLPQLIHLIRTRSVEGLSVVAWQAMLAVNLAWLAHGVSIGQAPQVVTTVMGLMSTGPILYLLSRHLDRSLLLLMLPGIVVAAGMIAVDRLFGSAVYGLVAILPAVVSNAGQSVELVRAAHVRGVSPLFTVLAFANQIIWLFWATLVADPGTIIVASTAGFITAVNLVWYLGRRLSLRAFFGRDGFELNDQHAAKLAATTTS